MFKLYYGLQSNGWLFPRERKKVLYYLNNNIVYIHEHSDYILGCFIYYYDAAIRSTFNDIKKAKGIK